MKNYQQENEKKYDMMPSDDGSSYEDSETEDSENEDSETEDSENEDSENEFQGNKTENGELDKNSSTPQKKEESSPSLLCSDNESSGEGTGEDPLYKEAERYLLFLERPSKRRHVSKNK